jgi:secreted trypsin-like serine protease
LIRGRLAQVGFAIGAAAALATACGSLLAARPAEATQAQASVVGGRAADFDDWRFTVAIFHRRYGFWCGGSVIGSQTVLTAAHCVKGIRARSFVVVANRYRLRDTSQGERIGVAEKQVNPAFRYYKARHDAAVLTLSQPTSAPPVALATPEDDAAVTRPGSRLRVAGWGSVNPYRMRLPRLLREATVRVRRNRVCRRVFPGTYSGATNICAAGILMRRGIHKSSCYGDSGGPLIADTPSGPRQVGIVSYGTGVCGRGPSVFSRVSSELAFISGG